MAAKVITTQQTVVLTLKEVSGKEVSEKLNWNLHIEVEKFKTTS